MPQYDGSININTKIDTKNVSSQMLRLENQISKASKKASDLTQKMREMENRKIPTEDYKDISDALHRSNQQFDKLLQKQQSMISSGKTSGKVWDDLDRKIEEVGADIRAAEKYQSKMVSDGTAYMSADAIRSTDAYRRLSDQLINTNAQIKTLSKRHEELSEKENKVSNNAKKAHRSTDRWLNSFSGKTKRAGGLIRTLASRIKGIALSLFIFNWITKGWNAMISAIKDGTQNVAKYSSDVNAKMSAMSSAIATLKNAFGSLSAPIINTVGPAITYFINMLTSAINKVNQFISALTGKSTWIKATTQVVDYAGGLESAASGAENAASAAKKLKGQLQSFNELNVINSNDSGSGSGGSGGSGGGGGVSDMFEEVPIDSGIKNIADEIRKAIETGDWEGLGETIRSKITETIGKIPWNSLYSNAKDFGKNFASFLNGLFSSDKKGNNVFTATADVIAGALNTAVFASKGFTDNFKFEQFGRNLASGFNRFFRKFKWKQCAEAINGWVDGFWDTVISFFENLDYKAIFNGLKDFITNLSPETIATIIGIVTIKSFGTKIGTAINDNLNVNLGKITVTITGIVFAWAAGTAIGEAMDKAIGQLWEEAGDQEMADFYKNFHWTGEGGFFDQLFGNGESVLEVFVDIGTAMQLMWEDINGTQGAFDSLKKKMKELSNVNLAIKVALSTTAVKLWLNFKKNWDDIKNKVVGVSTSIVTKAKDLFESFKKSWGNTKMLKTLLGISTSPSKLWETFKKSWGITKKVQIGISFFSNALSNLWTSVKNVFAGKSISIGADVKKKAGGGIYSGGIWHDITHYAVGTSNAPTGQVFVAREAGPELVGTLGGHTAVMNNDQIVASVSDGVYRAVRSAIGNGKQNLNVTFKVEGDPNGIFRVTQQKANEYFRSTGNPAFDF